MIQEISCSSGSLSEMTSQIKYKNWDNFGSRFDFDLRFLEEVSLNKIKFHKIRCRSWSTDLSGNKN